MIYRRAAIWCGLALIIVGAAGCTAVGPTGPSTAPAAVSTGGGPISPAASSPALASPLSSRTAPSGPAVIGPAPSSPAEIGPAPSKSTPSSTAVISSAAGVTAQASPGAVPVPSLPFVGVVGVNDPTCHSGKRPVVLLHGTFSTVASNFSVMVPSLSAAGRCVFALEYGHGGLAAVTTSAGEFAAFVATVRRVTGARQVDVVAYSQGGLVLRTGLRLDGLAEQVATAVLIAPSWNGTTAPLAGALPANFCPACADQVAGSPLLRKLDLGGDLDGDVRYAEVSTRGDTVVTPIGSQVPAGSPDRVRSIVAEDRCPRLVTDHVHLPGVAGVIHWVLAALATDGRPVPADLTC